MGWRCFQKGKEDMQLCVAGLLTGRSGKASCTSAGHWAWLWPGVLWALSTQLGSTSHLAPTSPEKKDVVQGGQSRCSSCKNQSKIVTEACCKENHANVMQNLQCIWPCDVARMIMFCRGSSLQYHLQKKLYCGIGLAVLLFCNSGITYGVGVDQFSNFSYLF